jgi:diguanylate cyclase (GGDEF)-like protein/PAS domain S-box-containing protein
MPWRSENPDERAASDLEHRLGGHQGLLERLPIVTFVAELSDGRARLRYISPQIEELTGFPAEEWLGDSPLFVDRIHPDDRDEVLAGILARFEPGTPPPALIRWLHRDGRTIWVDMRRVSLETQGSKVAVGTVADVTARMEAERALAKSEQMRTAVFESLDEGLIVLDRDGAVIAANRNAAEMLGVVLERLHDSGVATPAVAAYFEDGARIDFETSVALQVLRDGAEVRDVPIRLVREDGSERWVNANYFPLRDSDDEVPRGVIWSLTDITDARRLATRLAESERRFRDIAENVRAVFWVRNTETGEVLYVSPGYEEIWGRPVDALLRNGGAWIDAIHPDDRPRVMREALAREASDAYDAEYRIIRPDGSTRWIHDRAFTLRGSVEQAEVVTGMAEDVTERRETEHALAEARERARAAFLNAPTGSAIFAVEDGQPGAVLEVNPALCAMLGYPEAVLLGADPQLVTGQLEISDSWRRLAAGAIDTYGVEHPLTRSDGREIFSRLQVSLIRDADGDPIYGVVQVEDITAARRSEAQQVAVARLGQRALESVSLPHLMDEAVAAVRETLGTAVAGILEYDGVRDVLVGRVVDGLPDGISASMVAPVSGSTHMRAALDERKPIVVEDWSTETRFEISSLARALDATSTVSVPIQGPKGAWGVMSTHSREQRSFAPDEVSFVQAVANVLGAAIQRWLAEEDTRHRALHDPLTELPNRTLFLDRLGHALERTKRGGGAVAVLFMDLDHFKVINDSLGHEAGDRLLQAFAPRLQETLRPSDTVGRFGGDEFVVLAEDLHTEDDAVHLAERILASLERPFHIDQHELFTSATIGLALARAGATPEALIRDADAAMYRAKAHGRGRYELFDQAMRERVSERLRTETALRKALAEGGLELYFQPIVAMEDRSIVGAEALLRWNDAERGWISPADFIAIAEESGLIVPLGEWVLEEAARTALAWPTAVGGAAPPRLAVNLSARQVAHPQFCDRLAATLERTGLPAERLSLEITESILIDGAEGPMNAMRELKDLGVRLALDDFGTGYSSLSYLNRLPIDVLKLDRSFIAPLRERGHTMAAIVSGMITMAEALGMTVVAEGVEELSQAERLRALGCDFAQGFLFAKPLPPDQLDGLLRAGALPTPRDVADPARR